MTFNSVPYLLLLAMTVVVFWWLPAHFRRGLVFVVSVAFYASWGLRFVWLPLLVAGIVYVAGRQMSTAGGNQKLWARMGIACVVMPLIFFKYRVFLFANLWPHGISHGSQSFSSAASLVFPLGISFYTFEAIAYLIDLRQGRVKAPGFVELCLFFFFWPNVLSGPIVRARELMPQLDFQTKFEPRFCFEGMDRFVWGLVQKNVIANVLGDWVDRGFAAGAAVPSTLDGWALASAFALQIYFDFAAYTNMAIGAARFIGVTLPDNFRQPYHAVSPPDFWSRWHMTLSRWVRDYLFFPINAKFAGAALPLYLSLIGVMALVGLWHGAGWGFLAWGTLHGVCLAFYRIYESWKGNRPRLTESRLALEIWRAVTLVAVTSAWVPFRASSLQTAGVILFSMFYPRSLGASFSPVFYGIVAVLIVFCACEPWLMQGLTEFEANDGLADGPSPFRLVIRPIAYSFGLLLFTLFDEHNAQFIYSQF
jgi:alginate O-acetyltransferase complex protein AlgI